jgi:hypothetical protein
MSDRFLLTMLLAIAVVVLAFAIPAERNRTRSLWDGLR